MSDTATPGTYRADDQSAFPFSDALELWLPIAHELLRETATRYNDVTTYGEVAETVQVKSGIRTRSLVTNWIGGLLEKVAVRAKELGEPPLTSLCVYQDGTIGPGYAKAPKSVDDDVLEDIELYAALHRLLCYREYAVDLPADGGEPTLTRQVAERRSRSAPKVARPVALCPVHHTTLPASGRCDYCD